MLHGITKDKLACGAVAVEDVKRSKPTATMTPNILRREFPAPSLTVFFVLQALDVLTTLIGLSAGASEASVFVGRLLQLGPLAGLLVAKCFAIVLVGAALRYKRPRVIVILNYWFAAIITWNLAMIGAAMLRTA